MLTRRQLLGWSMLTLVGSTLLLPAYAQQQYDQQRLNRKFHSKPNNIKKQGYIPGYSPEEPHGYIGGFPGPSLEKNDVGFGPALGPSGPPGTTGSSGWGKTLNMILQFVMGAAQAFTSGAQIEKVDSGTDGFSWAKLISIGMQVLLNVLGGGSEAQIEKNDNPAQNAVQGVLATVLGLAMGDDDPASVQVMAKQATELFSVVMNLVEALKTSFSERSLQARALGQSDYTADAAVTAVTMLEGVVRHALLGDDVCGQKSLCMASRECMERTDKSDVFCEVGGFAASYLTPRSLPMSMFEEAGRLGRAGSDCDVIYSQCNLI